MAHLYAKPHARIQVSFQPAVVVAHSRTSTGLKHIASEDKTNNATSTVRGVDVEEEEEVRALMLAEGGTRSIYC